MAVKPLPLERLPLGGLGYFAASKKHPDHLVFKMSKASPVDPKQALEALGAALEVKVVFESEVMLGANRKMVALSRKSAGELMGAFAAKLNDGELALAAQIEFPDPPLFGGAFDNTDDDDENN
jgi:hypothetical protein